MPPNRRGNAKIAPYKAISVRCQLSLSLCPVATGHSLFGPRTIAIVPGDMSANAKSCQKALSAAPADTSNPPNTTSVEGAAPLTLLLPQLLLPLPISCHCCHGRCGPAKVNVTLLGVQFIVHNCCTIIRLCRRPNPPCDWPWSWMAQQKHFTFSVPEAGERLCSATHLY